MKNALMKIDRLCNINISSIKGMISILKNIKTNESYAVRSVLAQLMTVDVDIQKTATVAISQRDTDSVIKSESKAVDWAAVTEDIE